MTFALSGFGRLLNSCLGLLMDIGFAGEVLLNTSGIRAAGQRGEYDNLSGQWGQVDCSRSKVDVIKYAPWRLLPGEQRNISITRGSAHGLKPH